MDGTPFERSTRLREIRPARVDDTWSGWASRLEARLPPATGRPVPRVKVTVGTDGKATVSVSRIPLDQWEAFLPAAQGVALDG